MTTRSEPLNNGRTAAEEKAANPRRPIGASSSAAILMLMFGIPLWLVGAKYSLDGWTIALNIVAAALELPARLPEPSGWWNLLLLPLGVIYSFVETKLRIPRGVGAGVLLVFLALLLLTHASDMGSTLLATLSPGENAWPLAQWAAAAVWPAAIWAVVLTYLPELLIVTAVALLSGRRP